MLTDLVHGAALLLALSLLFGFSLRLRAFGTVTRQIVAGLIFGGVCVVGMYVPVELAPGVIFDARTVVLGMAGLFGGPLVGGLAAAIAGGYRLYLGGVGAVIGVATILVATLAGIGYRYLRRRGVVGVGIYQFAVFGLLVHVAALALFTQLPAEIADRVMRELALPYLLVFVPATVLLGLLLHDTERRSETEDALALSEARMRAIVSAIPDQLFVVEADGRVREGLSSSALPSGAGRSGFLPPETRSGDADRVRRVISWALESGATRTVEYTVNDPAGARVREARIQRLDGAAGEEPCAIALVRDITDRRQAEADRQLAAIAFEANEGIAITDADGRTLRVNSAWSRITGETATETAGHLPAPLRVGSHDAAFHAELWAAVAREGSWSGEIWHRRRDGTSVPVWLRVTAVLEGGYVTHHILSLMDLTEQKELEARLQDLAFFDPITHLPNRRLMFDRLQRTLRSSERRSGHGAFLHVDLDNFKALNEAFGHDTGDAMLRAVAGRLQGCVRESDTVAHIGGDEFAVMLEGLDDDAIEAAQQVERVGEKVLAALHVPYELAGRRYQATASIGATLFAAGEPPVNEVMKQADLAMHGAKTDGRDMLRFFDPGMQANVDRRAALEQDLRAGIDASQFTMHYQMQVDTAGDLVGVEALLRWPHPERGLVSPGEFIPLAEETGLIHQLGRVALEMTCRQIADWEQVPGMRQVTAAFNVSARQLLRNDFVDEVETVLRESGANPGRLQIELTESVVLEDVETIIERMDALRRLGVTFSLDDFGTGYSSLAYLKRLPLSVVKIDRSFVRDILSDPSDAVICRAIISLAESLGFDVIAEGVESREQHDRLVELGCRLFQGFLYATPMPADRLADAVGE